MECDGVRDRTRYIPLGKFDELALLSDYRFLEETGQCVDNAMRYPMRRPRFEFQDNRLPYPLHRMIVECRRRGTTLLILPEKFQRRKANTTYINFRKREVFWRIEWVFHQTGVKYVSEKVSEKMSLGQALEPFLSTELCTSEGSKHVLAYKLAGLSGITPLMKVERIKSKVPQYVELDFSKSILANMIGNTIVEFPTIILVLLEHKQEYTLLGSVPKVKRELEEGEIETTDTEEDMCCELPNTVPKTEQPSPVISSTIKLVADYSFTDTESE